MPVDFRKRILSAFQQKKTRKDAKEEEDTTTPTTTFKEARKIEQILRNNNALHTFTTNQEEKRDAANRIIVQYASPKTAAREELRFDARIERERLRPTFYYTSRRTLSGKRDKDQRFYSKASGVERIATEEHFFARSPPRRRGRVKRHLNDTNRRKESVRARRGKEEKKALWSSSNNNFCYYGSAGKYSSRKEEKEKEEEEEFRFRATKRTKILWIRLRERQRRVGKRTRRRAVPIWEAGVDAIERRIIVQAKVDIFEAHAVGFEASLGDEKELVEIERGRKDNESDLIDLTEDARDARKK